MLIDNRLFIVYLRFLFEHTPFFRSRKGLLASWTEEDEI